MATLDDAALREAARATMPVDQRARLDALHELQRTAPLSPEEKAEERSLLSLYRDTLLIRAQAAVLLRQRGYDVSDPSVVLTSHSNQGHDAPGGLVR